MHSRKIRKMDFHLHLSLQMSDIHVLTVSQSHTYVFKINISQKPRVDIGLSHPHRRKKSVFRAISSSAFVTCPVLPHFCAITWTDVSLLCTMRHLRSVPAAAARNEDIETLGHADTDVDTDAAFEPSALCGSHSKVLFGLSLLAESDTTLVTHVNSYAPRCQEYQCDLSRYFKGACL